LAALKGATFFSVTWAKEKVGIVVTAIKKTRTNRFIDDKLIFFRSFFV